MAQPLARLVVALFEPRAPDSFAAWGLFNACFEQKEHMEPYVAEQIAQKMFEQDPLARRGIPQPVLEGCDVRRESGCASGVLFAPPRIVGFAIQPLSGAAGRGKSGIPDFAAGAAGRRRKCSDVRM